MITFAQLVLYCVLSIVLATGLHAAWLNLGRVISRKYKTVLGLVEFGSCLSLLCFHGYDGSIHILGAVIILFPFIRWMRDYLLNLLRGKSWNYLPARDPNYGSLTDDFLRDGFTIWGKTIKIKGRHNQLAFRLVLLLISFIIAYHVYYA